MTLLVFLNQEECCYSVKEQKRTAAMVCAIKNRKTSMMTCFAIKGRLPVSSSHSFPPLYLFVYCSQISSHLRFTEPLFKCVYILHMTVCLEQSEYTIFEEI